MLKGKESNDDSSQSSNNSQSPKKKVKKDKKSTIACIPKNEIRAVGSRHKARIAVSHGNPLTEKAHLEALINFALASYLAGTDIKIIASYGLYRFNKLYDLLMQSTPSDLIIQHICKGDSPITIKELEHIRTLAEGEASEIVNRSGEAWEGYHLPLIDKVWKLYCEQRNIPIEHQQANKPSLERWSKLQQSPLFKQILLKITQLFFRDPSYKREVDESVGKRLNAVKERAMRGGKIFNEKLFYACAVAFMLEECAAFTAYSIDEQINDIIYIDEMFAALRATRDLFIAQSHPNLLHWVAMEFIDHSPRSDVVDSPNQKHLQSPANKQPAAAHTSAASQPDSPQNRKELSTSQQKRKQSLMTLLKDKLGSSYSEFLALTDDLPEDEASVVISQAFTEFGTKLSDQRSRLELFPLSVIPDTKTEGHYIARVTSSESVALTPEPSLEDISGANTVKQQSDASSKKDSRESRGSQIARLQNAGTNAQPTSGKPAKTGKSSPGLIMGIILGAIGRKISPDKYEQPTDTVSVHLIPRRTQSTPEGEDFVRKREAVGGTYSEAFLAGKETPAPVDPFTPQPVARQPAARAGAHPGLFAPTPVNPQSAVNLVQTHAGPVSKPADHAESAPKVFVTTPFNSTTAGFGNTRSSLPPIPIHPATLSTSTSPAAPHVQPVGGNSPTSLS